jgi:deoxyribonuclease IV
MYIGAHVSIAGGFDKCLDRIDQMGGNCLMTFASSPRSLQFKDLEAGIVESYIEKKKTLKIGPHFFHGVYLVNLATENHDYLEVSMKSLAFYQRLAGKIGGAGTIFHIGSHKGRGIEEVMEQLVGALDRLLENTPHNVKLNLENAAGHAGTIGSTLEELAKIINKLDDKAKVGVCLDTQHAFASGIALDELVDRFDTTIGLEYLSAIHFNDSKPEFGSHLDRHENLGEGLIGMQALKKFINDERLSEVPFILEVPGVNKAGPAKVDIDTAKSLILK